MLKFPVIGDLDDLFGVLNAQEPFQISSSILIHLLRNIGYSALENSDPTGSVEVKVATHLNYMIKAYTNIQNIIS